MADFSKIIARGDTVIPEPVANDIIQELPHASVVLSRARTVRMPSKTYQFPILSALPEAQWVNGDTDLKETTKAEWDTLTLTAEELAVLVPVPDAVIDDSQVPIWDEVRPLLVEAVGKKVDQAALFGVNKPASWPTGVVPAAIASGNSVVEGTYDDLAVDIAEVARLVAEDGYAVNGFATAPGFNWQLVGLRAQDSGVPIYGAPLQAGQPGTLYGLALNEVYNGSWDASEALVLAADWSKFIIGIRQDITFSISDSATISDTDGKVIFNAFQQDSKILRVVLRVGFQVAKPLTRVGGSSRYPAGVLAPAGSGS